MRGGGKEIVDSMSVKELKAELAQRNISIIGMSEKSELVDALRAVWPDDEPSAPVDSFDTMSVKELKAELAQRNISNIGMTEKSDMVAALRAALHHDDPASQTEIISNYTASNKSAIISILTWNISWGSMTMNKRDRGSVKMVTESLNLNSNLNIYFNNFLQHITSFYMNYDFLCFQEYVRHDEIYNRVKQVFRFVKLDVIFNHLNVQIITYYNYQKYKLLGCNEFSINTGNPEDIRPGVLCIFNNIETNNKVLVINLHNQHDFGGQKQILELYINQGCNLFFPTTEENITITKSNDTILVNEINADTLLKLALSQNHDVFRTLNIMCAGDFNDMYRANYYNNLTININGREFILSGDNPPKTCCEDSTNIDKPSVYSPNDYILTNDTITIAEPLNTYRPPTIVSDHLPCTLKIRFN